MIVFLSIASASAANSDHMTDIFLLFSHVVCILPLLLPRLTIEWSHASILDSVSSIILSLHAAVPCCAALDRFPCGQTLSPTRY